MTSLERVLTALSHKEPDKVPLFLLLSHYGAKELGISIKEYFSKPEYVLEGQMKMQAKYKTDCLFAFFYASIETEAFGGKTIFVEKGSPNSSTPIIQNPKEIESLKVPKVKETKQLIKVLDTIKMLKREAEDKVPIIGVVMSPFSLPVMQLGFDKYLDLIFHNKEMFNKLMHINEQFCIDWANAQIEAGATAICYFDPVSSPTIIPRKDYLETGFQIAKRTIAKINGPTATHLASGRSLAIMDDLARTGTAIAGVSSLEDIAELKSAAKGKISLLGNMNGVEMCRWTKTEAEENVKNIIQKAGNGGGLLLGENHGEIPYQVSEKTLLDIANAVDKWGVYPLKN